MTAREFNNRIDAQREILMLVNDLQWKEELYGLSRGAIERWMKINEIDPYAELPLAVCESAHKLFFLANKSQEQITDEYRLLSEEVHTLTKRLGRIVDGVRGNG